MAPTLYERGHYFSGRWISSLTKKEWYISSLYKKFDHLTAYSKHMDLRVENNPQDAVGGLWQELGKLQFSFLIDKGLKPENRLLDIGCGTLRGGRHFIRFLDEGNYTGMDISRRALDFGKSLVEEEQLVEKNPTLLLNTGYGSIFDCVGKRKFDFLLAQSVFTHLPKENLKDCFEHLRDVANPGFIFFFTFFEADSYARLGNADFAYPFRDLQKFGTSFGLHVENLSKQYRHPHNQKMAAVTAL